MCARRVFACSPRIFQQSVARWLVSLILQYARVFLADEREGRIKSALIVATINFLSNSFVP